MNERAADRLRIFAMWAINNGYVKSVHAFEKRCGLSQRYIAAAMTSPHRGDLTTATVSRVYEAFPMLNTTWLCTGIGSMILPDENPESQYKIAYEAAMQQIAALNKIIASKEM